MTLPPSDGWRGGGRTRQSSPVTSGPTHYFSERPDVDGPDRVREVELMGRTVRVRSGGGVFSADRVDPGTSVLLRRAGAVPQHGDLLDLGCGWGPITLALAMQSPGATVWAVDVNERARELTASNARDAGLANVRVCAPDEVDADVAFTAIWSNPPIRIGKEALHMLLLRWLPRLAAGGHAELVVQKHLGADSLHRWLGEELPTGFSVSRTASSKGYRVLRVDRSVTG